MARGVWGKAQFRAGKRAPSERRRRQLRKLSRKARGYGNCPGHAGMAGEGDHLSSVRTNCLQREILTAAEDFRVFAAEFQGLLNHKLLHGAALPGPHEVR